MTAHDRIGRPLSDASTTERAITRLLAELYAGLQHGYFEYSITCEVIGQSRRRLTIHAGKAYQFMIPFDECVHVPKLADDSCDGSKTNAE